MLFHQGIFCPEFLGDPRVRVVLTSVVHDAPPIVGTIDLLAAAILHGDPPVLATLACALGPAHSPRDLLAGVLGGFPSRSTGSGAPRDRASFTPPALEALDEFDGILQGAASVFDGFALELLLHCLLTRLGEREQKALAGLDVEQAAALFRDQVARAVDPGTSEAGGTAQGPHHAESRGGPDTPFVLPPRLFPSEDLTHRARTAAVPAAFPFDAEPRYEQLFDAIGRILHRRQANHVLLTGERGVGKTTVLAELARRAATGRIPFLQERRFLQVDCRYLPPDESRQRLVALLGQVADHAELIVCLDGFPSLLRADRVASNKAVLLSALARARCQLIGLLTEREFEELVSDDPDFGEFFTRVDVDEPDLAVALKILQHFALGLEQHFGVAIDAEAVRQAVQLSANYILNDHLPAKALKLLHRVCEDIDYERSQLGRPRQRVTADDMVRAVAQKSGVPEETLRGRGDIREHFIPGVTADAIPGVTRPPERDGVRSHPRDKME